MAYLGTKPNVATSLQDNIVTSDKINDGAVQTADIANSAVTPAKLSTGAPTWNTSGGLMIGQTTSQGTLTVNGNITPTAPPNSAWGLDFAPGTGSGSFVSLANNATYNLSTGSGLVFIADNAAAGFAQIFLMYGTSFVTNISGSLFTPTQGTAGKVNVYVVFSPSVNYQIQNLSGTTINLFIGTIRLRAST